MPVRRSATSPGGIAARPRASSIPPIRPSSRRSRREAGQEGRRAASRAKPSRANSASAAAADFANTDMAFAGDMMVAGSYHGFNAYRLGADGVPELVSSTVCPGGQGDVSIVGKLLIMSVERTARRTDCGLQGVGRTSAPNVSAASGSSTSRTSPAPPGRPGADLPRQPYPFGGRCEGDSRIVVYSSGTSTCARARNWPAASTSRATTARRCSAST